MKLIFSSIFLLFSLYSCGDTKKSAEKDPLKPNNFVAFSVTPSVSNQYMAANQNCRTQKTFFFSPKNTSELRESCSGTDPNAQPFTTFDFSLSEAMANELNESMKIIDDSALVNSYITSPSNSDTDGASYRFTFYRNELSPVNVIIDSTSTAILPTGLAQIYDAVTSGKLGL